MKRWVDHCKPSSTSCTYLKHSINVHGKDNFKIEELASSWSEDNLNELEKYFIIVNNSLSPNGYNLKAGGEGGKLSQQARINLSNALKGKKKRPRTDAEKEYIRKKITGIKRTQQTKDRMSRSFKGRTLPKNIGRSKAVVSYNLYTEELVQYPSLAEANRKGFGIHGTLPCVLNKQTHFKDCLWFYKSSFTKNYFIHKLILLLKHFSHFKGIKYHQRDELWVASIKVRTKSKHLGYYKVKEDAQLAYKAALICKFPYLEDLVRQYGWR